MKKKEKVTIGLSLLGIFSSYWVFSASIPVKQVFHPDGSPKLTADGMEIWGRNRPLEIILDLPGYTLLFVAFFFLVRTLYHSRKQEPQYSTI